MGGTSADRIAGVALAAGAALGIFAMLIRPGQVLVKPLEHGTTLLERVRTLSDYAALTHTSSLLGALGLLLLLFGFFAIRRAMDDRSAPDAFVRMGILMLTFGGLFMISVHGLNHMIVHIVNHGADTPTPVRTLLTMAVTVQAVKAGILLIAGYGRLLGLALIGLGLFMRFTSGFNKGIAAVAAVVSLAALIVLGIGDHFHDLTSFYKVASLMVIPLNVWAIVLGVQLFMGYRELTPAR